MISSLQLVELINKYRKEEGNLEELTHSEFAKLAPSQVLRQLKTYEHRVQYLKAIGKYIPPEELGKAIISVLEKHTEIK